ncbi:MAG: PorP/SprF family type IX secretion system membrane protein [Proteiniphilum sp.]|nr:PorP/SprF family type IX secretion system membrane protein [Proteiniphilum sp.]
MGKRRFLCLLFLQACCLLNMQAQWNAPFSHYWMAKGYYNPSFAGEGGQIRATALYRFQWTGIKNAPQRMLITGDMPFLFHNRLHAAGVVAYNDVTGTFRNSLLAAQYCLRQPAGKGFLNIGLQAGVYNLAFDPGSINITGDHTQQDMRGTVEVYRASGKVFDLNAGISWIGDNSFAGISAMHIGRPRFSVFSDSITGNTPIASNTANITGASQGNTNYNDQQPNSTDSFVPRSYIFIAGCNIRLFYPLEIKPIVLLETEPGDTQVLTTIRLEYDKKYSGGISWRKGDGYAIFTGANLEDLEFGYACSFHSKGMGKDSRGSHELYLRYNISSCIFKPARQPNKSIRLL